MMPFITFFGKEIPTYGICMLLGFLVVTFTTAIKSKKINIPADSVLVITALILAGAIVCGTALYIFVTYPITYMIDSMKMLDFTFITSGGIVFYGGLIGGIAGAIISGRLLRIDIWSLEDIVVPLIPLGHAIGRIGCLLSGCCYGIPYSGPLAICYTNSLFNLPGDMTYFPVQLLEALLDIIIMLYLLYYVKKPHKQNDVLFMYIFLYALMRFCTEFLRGDSIRGLFMGLSTSQWISIGLIIIFVIRELITTYYNSNSKKCS